MESFGQTTEGGSVTEDNSIFVGGAELPQWLNLKRANRHGLVAGATGTGKTVTLQILCEGLSAQGVPVFVADVKGDLSGLSQPGTSKDFLEKRAATIGFDDYAYEACPVIFWDVFGKQGHPVRSTISEMGPTLLARLLELNDTQEGVLFVAFEVADDQGLMLLDIDDLRAMLTYLGENAAEIRKEYGNVSAASIGAIQRRLLKLQAAGAEQFFGEPALELADFMRTTRDGRGYVNILAADDLILSPGVYGTVLLWLLSELFEELPEVGDPEKPRLVFFFDEAHLLFDDAPKALLERLGQVVRLIRSKGVGVYFVTQNPQDVPDEVLGQLGNRVQHALRAYTPRDAKAVRTAAQTFRQNPELDTETVITELGVGEALTSFLDAKGVPGIVQRTLIRPPSSRLGPVTEAERRGVMNISPVAGQYDKAVDRDSAHEILTRRAEEMARKREEEEAREAEEKEEAARAKREAREARTARSYSMPRTRRRRSSNRQSIGEAAAKSIVRAVSTQVGRALVRGLLGSLSRR
ncbi:helicase HerA-like domain-containing protein [Pseudooceanicola antarcticus]|uniref:helicase HerA-like domain-containing protein n=1 Tax=Pseudooceanicola antarcticus TaxID=1247613 RepID=UPI0039F66521